MILYSKPGSKNFWYTKINLQSQEYISFVTFLLKHNCKKQQGFFPIMKKENNLGQSFVKTISQIIYIKGCLQSCKLPAKAVSWLQKLFVMAVFKICLQCLKRLFAKSSLQSLSVSFSLYVFLPMDWTRASLVLTSVPERLS